MAGAARPGQGLRPRWTEAGPARPRLPWLSRRRERERVDGSEWGPGTHSQPVATPALSSGHQPADPSQPCDPGTDTCEAETEVRREHRAPCEARRWRRPEAGCEHWPRCPRPCQWDCYSESVVTHPRPRCDTVTHILFPRSRDLRMPGPGWWHGPGLTWAGVRARPGPWPCPPPHLLHGVSAPTDGQHAGRPRHLWPCQHCQDCEGHDVWECGWQHEERPCVCMRPGEPW